MSCHNEELRHIKSNIISHFNINLLEHSSHLPTKLFLNSMQVLNYFPHISRPTRFPDSPALGQPSLLDHIGTNFLTRSPSGSIEIFLHIRSPSCIFININNETIPNIKLKITYRVINTNNKDIY